MITISEKKFKNREELLKAALNEFSTYSYEMASLNRIITESKSSKGSFYYHFENKENLYIQLLQQSVEAKWNFINKYMEEQKKDFSQMDIFDKFLFQAEMAISFGNLYSKYNLLGEMFKKEKGSDVYNKAIEQLNIENEDMLSSMIEEAYEHGQLNDYYSKEFITSLMTYLFASFNDIFILPIDANEKLDTLKKYVHFMKYGLA